MAEEKLQYQVTFKTRSEGDGAQKTAAAVRDLRSETERLNGLSTAEKTRDTQWAFYDLDAEIRRTNRTVQNHSESTNTSAKATRNYGAAIGQAGFQIQDFAVQVGAGQNAMVAFAQQGSQLLGMFGPQGAIAGALLAVGAIAFNVFSKMSADARSVLPDGEELNKLLGEIRTNAENASDEDIDFALGAMQAATLEAEKLRDRWRETNTAAASYEASQLNNQEKIRQAALEWRKLRGEQTDGLAEIEAKETAMAAQRQLAADQAIADQRKKSEAAAGAAKEAANELAAAGQLSIQTQKDLDDERAKLALLREQAAELEKQSSQKRGWTEAHSTPGLPWQPTEEAKIAAESLKAVEAALAAQEGKISSLEQSLGEQGAITQRVIDAAQKLTDTSVAANDLAGAVEIKTEEITAALNAETIKGKVEQAAAVATATADEIKAAIPQLQTVNQDQVAAKESLTKLTADGQLTVNETAQALRDLQTLFQGNSDLVGKMISFMQQSQAKQREQDKLIGDLLKKLDDLRNNGNR